MLLTQRLLMSTLWNTHRQPEAAISLHHPLSYADRLRIRQPADASFSLGPHMDGGSVERWERQGYGRGGVYDAIFQGRWDASVDDGKETEDAKAKGGGYDPWDASTRVHATTDLYNGLGACSMFRMMQGWLSLSCSGGARAGSLMVHPLLRESTAYTLLRPFFRPLIPSSPEDHHPAAAAYLAKHNWVLATEAEMTSALHGATPSHGQEFPHGMHPHLALPNTMVHIPRVRPGDFVAWHCDAIHAVDKVHEGTGDSSVLYIPVCPATEANARYLVRQREAWGRGTPAPDFPGGEGESGHVGRGAEGDVLGGEEGRAAVGLGVLRVGEQEGRKGVREAVERVNRVLGF